MVVDELHRTSRRIVRVVGDIGYNIAELRLAGSNKILLQILRVQPQTIQSRRGPTRSTNWIRRVADLVDDVTILSDVVPSSTMACSNRLDIWMMLSKSRAGRPIECAQRSRNRGKRENDVPHLGVIRVQVGIE